ncbi:MAG: nucleoside kinase [Ruminococcus sp.]|jgi:uridine kinase|nr:nucleoside kinase [Ruminococcus sp.]
MNFLDTKSINSALERDAEGFIKLSEEIYNVNILTAAEHIRLLAAGKPIVLIAGPSGSSKTTTAGRLGECLRAAGVEAFCISMDNYFYPKDEALHTPKTPDGKIDFESPYRVDIPRFTKDLNAFVKGEEIITPHFDFLTQKRSDGIIIKRPEDGVVIIEGIHALNPMLTETVKEHTFGIYVSVKTRLKCAEHSLPPSMVRLMRRLSRDKRFRGRTPLEIWEMYKLVALGEEQYIKPFRPLADLDIDTFIPYEAAVYKSFLEEDVKAISGQFPDNTDLKTLSEVLESLIPLSESAVPEYSIVHEFI